MRATAFPRQILDGRSCLEDCQEFAASPQTMAETRKMKYFGRETGEVWIVIRRQAQMTSVWLVVRCIGEIAP